MEQRDPFEPQGTFLGIPYEWRRPTVARFKHRLWNKEDDRIVVPRWYGWGYDFNFHAIGRRLSGKRAGPPTPPS
jgi:hypothetical protein